MLILRLAIVLLGGLVLSGQPAWAQIDAGTRQDPVLSTEGTLAIVSDYRFRGVSLSDGQPALQGELTVSHASGVYLSAWGPSLANSDGPDVETGLAIGLNKQIGAVQFDGSLFFMLIRGTGRQITSRLQRELRFRWAAGKGASPIPMLLLKRERAAMPITM